MLVKIVVSVHVTIEEVPDMYEDLIGLCFCSQSLKWWLDAQNGVLRVIWSEHDRNGLWGTSPEFIALGCCASKCQGPSACTQSWRLLCKELARGWLKIQSSELKRSLFIRASYCLIHSYLRKMSFSPISPSRGTQCSGYNTSPLPLPTLEFALDWKLCLHPWLGWASPLWTLWGTWRPQSVSDWPLARMSHCPGCLPQPLHVLSLSNFTCWGTMSYCKKRKSGLVMGALVFGSIKSRLLTSNSQDYWRVTWAYVRVQSTCQVPDSNFLINVTSILGKKMKPLESWP